MMRLHHVQVSCPRGGEAAARVFWAEGIGLVEVPKPAQLAGRGGCWFRAFDPSAPDRVVAEVHVGVEEPFSPARKAHPALVVDATEFEAVAGRLVASGFEVNHAERETLEGYLRFHCCDPFGNRVEVLTERPPPPPSR